MDHLSIRTSLNIFLFNTFLEKSAYLNKEASLWPHIKAEVELFGHFSMFFLNYIHAMTEFLSTNLC